MERPEQGSVPRFTYDLARAKALLAQSPYPKGFKATLQYPGGSSVHREIATILQQEWAALGIKVALQEVGVTAVANNLYAERYQLSIPFLQWTSDVTVPDEYAYFFLDPSTGTHGFFTHWSDPQAWSLTQRASGATSTTARAALWTTFQKRLNEQMPWINVMWLPSATAIRSNVCDVTVNGLGVYQFQYTWLAH